MPDAPEATRKLMNLLDKTATHQSKDGEGDCIERRTVNLRFLAHAFATTGRRSRTIASEALVHVVGTPLQLDLLQHTNRGSVPLTIACTDLRPEDESKGTPAATRPVSCLSLPLLCKRGLASAHDRRQPNEHRTISAAHTD